MDCSEKPTAGSLFSGIGGFDLGLERAGWRIVWQVENNPFCLRVLAKHWPEVARYGDIRDFPPANIFRPDIIVGGFPCQPHSTAGKRGGARDDRNLWPEYRRIIAELNPTWVVGENVSGIITTMLDDILDNLEDIGYATQAFNIPAGAFDKPHRRQRLWIIAHSNRNDGYIHQPRSEGKIWFGDDINGGSLPRGRREASWDQARSRVRRNDDGLPHWVDRIRALGNAVVPDIAQFLGELILKADRCKTI